MANQVEIIGPLSGTMEKVPMTLIRVQMPDGTVVGAIPISLTGGVSEAMLDAAVDARFRYQIMLNDSGDPVLNDDGDYVLVDSF